MVLAERDKEDMDKQLKKALWGHKVEWHTRSGAPHAIADLEKVAAGQARTIIILQPDQEEVGTLRCLVPRGPLSTSGGCMPTCMAARSTLFGVA